MKNSCKRLAKIVRILTVIKVLPSWKKRIKKIVFVKLNKKVTAYAENRTRINCLEGNYADHYTTNAWCLLPAKNITEFLQLNSFHYSSYHFIFFYLFRCFNWWSQCTWVDLNKELFYFMKYSWMYKRSWCNGQHSCLPSSWSEFDSRRTQCYHLMRCRLIFFGYNSSYCWLEDFIFDYWPKSNSITCHIDHIRYELHVVLLQDTAYVLPNGY